MSRISRGFPSGGSPGPAGPPGPIGPQGPSGQPFLAYKSAVDLKMAGDVSIFDFPYPCVVYGIIGIGADIIQGSGGTLPRISFGIGTLHVGPYDNLMIDNICTLAGTDYFVQEGFLNPTIPLGVSGKSLLLNVSVPSDFTRYKVDILVQGHILP